MDKDQESKFYDFQDEYFRSHPRWHIIYFDFALYDRLTMDGILLSDMSFLHSVFDGDIPVREVPTKDGSFNYLLDIPAITSLDDFNNFATMHKTIFHRKVKQKKNNDWARANHDAQGNIIRPKNV